MSTGEIRNAPEWLLGVPGIVFEPINPDETEHVTISHVPQFRKCRTCGHNLPIREFHGLHGRVCLYCRIASEAQRRAGISAGQRRAWARRRGNAETAVRKPLSESNG